jgi:hypothetical protein
MNGSGYPERITAAISKLESTDFPLTIELAGLPHSGKTTCSKSLDDLFRRAGIPVGRITERADVCPIVDKLTPDFNAWTIAAFIRQFLAFKSEGMQIVVADRGLFDATVWLRFMVSVGRCTPEVFAELRETAHASLWWPHQLIVLGFMLPTHTILSREAAQSVSPEGGSIVKAQNLDAYREALLEEAAACGGVVKLLEVENLSISELVHTAADVAISALEKRAGD